MSKFTTHWYNLTSEEAVAATTGHDMSYRKWVQEPNEIGKWMRRFLPKSARICDLGCGAGRNAGILVNYFNCVICTDLHLNVPAQSDYSLSGLFPYGQFVADAVLSCYVMQHIPPEEFSVHLNLLKRSEWLYLFLIETGNEFGFDFYSAIGTFAALIHQHSWTFEPNVLASVYLRKW